MACLLIKKTHCLTVDDGANRQVRLSRTVIQYTLIGGEVVLIGPLSMMTK